MLLFKEYEFLKYCPFALHLVLYSLSTFNNIHSITQPLHLRIYVHQLRKYLYILTGSHLICPPNLTINVSRITSYAEWDAKVRECQNTYFLCFLMLPEFIKIDALSRFNSLIHTQNHILFNMMNSHQFLVSTRDLQGKGSKWSNYATHPYFKESDCFHQKDLKLSQKFRFQAKIYSLHSIANQDNCLLDVFLHFLHTPFQKGIEKRFNKPFKFFITLYVFRDKMSPYPTKNTESKVEFRNALIGQSLQRQEAQNLQSQMRALFDEIDKEWMKQELYRMSLKQKHEHLQKYFNAMKNGICSVAKQLDHLVAQGFKDNQEDLARYIRNSLQMLQQVQWLKLDERLRRINYFLYTHQNYFNFFLVKQTQRYSKNIAYGIDVGMIKNAPAIISLQHYISLRESDGSYAKENKALIDQLYFLVKQYYQSNQDANGNNTHYKNLHPKYILYDQITLTLKLSHHPLIHEALGLQQEPLSTEGRIVHFPTPKLPSESCMTPVEISQKHLYNDPYYGYSWWYRKQSKVKDLWHDRQNRGRMEEQSAFWKFLHTVHFIYNHKYFNSKIRNKGDYCDSIVKLKQQVSQKPNKILTMVSSNYIQVPERLQFKFEELQPLLSIAGEDDSLLQQFGHKKIVKQLLFFMKLKEELKNIFKQYSLYFTSANIHLYFLIVCIEILTIIYYDIGSYELEMKRVGTRSILKKVAPYHNSKVEIVKNLQIFKAKLISYQGRNEKDKNYDFLKKDQAGKKWQQKLNDAVSEYLTIHRKQEEQNFYQHNQKRQMKKQLNDVTQFSQKLINLHKDILASFSLKIDKNRDEIKNAKKIYIYRKGITIGKCFISKRKNWSKYQFLLKNILQNKVGESLETYSDLSSELALIQQMIEQDSQ